MSEMIATDRPWPVRTVTIQVGNLTIPMEVIDTFDDVLDDFADSHPDDIDKIPYFADIWPSSIALATYLTKHPGLVQNQNVIELGCGLGLPSIVAAKLGAASVTATDFHPACIPYLKANTSKNGVPNILCKTLDWRKANARKTYNCIIGSDLLYEHAQVETLLACIQKIRTTNTKLILADPLRKHIQEATDKLQETGCTIQYTSQDEILILTATYNEII